MRGAADSGRSMVLTKHKSYTQRAQYLAMRVDLESLGLDNAGAVRGRFARSSALPDTAGSGSH